MRKTKEQKSELVQKLTSLKKQYKNGILFIVFDNGLEAFFDDAIVASGLCGFPLLRDVRHNTIIPYVSVSFSQFDKGVPAMLAAGHKVLVVGSRIIQVYQKN